MKNYKFEPKMGITPLELAKVLEMLIEDLKTKVTLPELPDKKIPKPLKAHFVEVADVNQKKN